MVDVMRKIMHNDKSSKRTDPSFFLRQKSHTIKFGLSLLLVFFAWFFILPTNICSYVYIFAAKFQMTDLLFILLSNVAGLLGLITGGLLVLFYKNMKKLLLTISSELVFVNILIFLAPLKLGLFFLLLQYMMLGIYVSVATCNYLNHTIGKKRYFFTGLILASIVTITALFAPASVGVTIESVYTMNFVLSLIVVLLVIALNVITPEQQQEEDTARYVYPENTNSGSFILLCIYAFILSFCLGYLTNETELFVAYSATISSLLNTLPYIGAVLIVFSLPRSKPHAGIITYIANAVLIIAIAYMDFFHSTTFMSGIVNLLLYAAIAVNELFIFDSILELAERSKYPSILVSIGLFVFVSGSAIGDHLGEAIIIGEISDFYRILITLIAFASSILPILRIWLSSISGTSIFRINPVMRDRMTPESASDQHVESESIPSPESSVIYPTVPQYDTLTNREKEVLDLLVKGYPTEVIASTLFISSNTLKRHIQNIYNKLNVHNRSELFKLLHKP